MLWILPRISPPTDCVVTVTAIKSKLAATKVEMGWFQVGNNAGFGFISVISVAECTPWGAESYSQLSFTASTIGHCGIVGFFIEIGADSMAR